ncbi:hypothetical protein EPO04_02690 [Patescibacteria group bacterium]|nr:MAG: hypothetical protein EPO04_02690 [Patescibacteria group bacterium]
MTIADNKPKVMLGIIFGLWLAYVFMKLSVINIFLPATGLANPMIGEKPSLSWKEHCYKQDSFCAKFPGKPSVQSSEMYQQAKYGVNNGPLYSTGVMVDGNLDATLTQEQQYASAIEGLTLAGLTVGSVSDVKLDGQPAKRVDINHQEQGTGTAVIAIYNGKRYVINSIGSQSEPIDTEGFINSFRFIK